MALAVAYAYDFDNSLTKRRKQMPSSMVERVDNEDEFQQLIAELNKRVDSGVMREADRGIGLILDW